MDKKPYILIIEDSSADAELMIRSLNKGGLNYTFKVADSKEEFLKALKEDVPDIILCDYNIPGFGATEALKIVRIKYPVIPFIVISGVIGEDVAIETIKYGAADYIMKDRMQRLTSAVQRALLEKKNNIEHKKLENKLLEEHKKFKSIINVYPEGIYIVNQQYEIEFINPALEKEFGAIQNRKCFEYFHDRKDPCPWCQNNKVFLGQTVRWEWTSLKNDKTYDLIDLPLLNEDGSISKLEIFHDVTERKRTEIQLAQAKDFQYKSLIEGIPAKVFLKDINSLYVYCNKNYAKDLNIEPEQITGKTDYDFFPTHLAQKYRSDDKRIMDSKKMESFEEEYVLAKEFLEESEMRYVNTIKLPMLNNEGKAVGLFGFFWDITEQKKLEINRQKILAWQNGINNLQHSLLVSGALEDKLKVITDGIVRIFDADFCRIWLIRPGDLCQKGCIHAQNKEGPHVCYNREKCLHLISSSGRYTHIDGKMHARIPFGCYKIGKIVSGKERKFLTNDVTNDPNIHDHKWASQLGMVSFAGYQLRIPEQESLGVLGLFAKHPITPVEDVTLESLSNTVAFVIQQDCLEQDRLQMQAFKASSEIKAKFTSMVSHELRSPLFVIKEGLNLVLEGLIGNINDRQKDVLDSAKKNIDRLSRLINNVLDFQKIDAGKMEFNILENDINETVSEALKNMEFLAREKGLKLIVNLDKSIPKIMFDKDRIIQVVTNLLGNSIKFTEKGKVTLITKKEENQVQVRVEDTGAGINSEDIPKLFQAFEQVGGEIGKKKGGTGLGLAISNEIVLAHKGKMWVESKFGQGSSFYFTLPIK